MKSLILVLVFCTLAAPAFAQLPEGTTLNVNFDGFYSWNANRPVGRINLLRAYDVTANSFTINQAGLVIERATDVSANKRAGFRLDLMFGQATETLQGGAQNEPRPQVYRNVFQAYGRYVAPVGKGLTVDFGKWASALGYENNYTKDQINYSRSYFFNYLPFYHMGLRTAYSVNDKLTLQYWLVNGANQTEDFNGFKSQNFEAIVTPVKSVSWTTNYYVGQEQRDLLPALNPGIPALPTQPGLSTTPADPPLRGRFHVFDTYVSWNATSKLTIGAEGDDVINRAEPDSPPSRVSGGAGYVQYQLVPSFALGSRFVYLSDRGGLFSGTTQAVKDVTLSATRSFGNNFQLRGELRRDFSNQPFFLTDVPGKLKKDQTTATIGMIWWFGNKQGAW